MVFITQVHNFTFTPPGRGPPPGGPTLGRLPNGTLFTAVSAQSCNSTSVVGEDASVQLTSTVEEKGPKRCTAVKRG